MICLVHMHFHLILSCIIVCEHSWAIWSRRRWITLLIWNRAVAAPVFVCFCKERKQAKSESKVPLRWKSTICWTFLLIKFLYVWEGRMYSIVQSRRIWHFRWSVCMCLCVCVWDRWISLVWGEKNGSRTLFVDIPLGIHQALLYKLSLTMEKGKTLHHTSSSITEL